MDPANPQNQNPESNPTPPPEVTPPPTQSPSQSPALTPSWAETTPDVPESPKLPDMTIKSEETPPLTPTTPGVPKKTNWPAVILSVLLVFALGGVGILAIQNYQLGKQIENQQVQTKETPVPTLPPMPTPTADPTATWKLYSNSKYGFSFKYPEEVQPNVKLEVTDSKIADTTALKANDEIWLCIPQSDGCYLQVYVYKSSLSASEWWQKDGVAMFKKLVEDFAEASTPKPEVVLPVWTVTNSTLAGQNVVIATGEVKAAQEGNLKITVISYKGNIFMLKNNYDASADSKDKSLMDQIVETFKFL